MRLLDLYCGEGLAAWGYWLSGRFSEVIGVDIDPEMRRSYSFNFICADALSLTYDFLLDFDFIHASPPCQAYSKITPDKSIHPRLILPTRLMLEAAGKPFVMENVEGSGAELRPNLALSGRDVGLRMLRKRYFHISSGLAAHPDMSIDRRIKVSTRQLINHLPGANVNVHGGKEYISRAQLIEAFGLECIPEKRLARLTKEGIEQGIPPRFTQRIAEAVIPNKFMVG